MGYEMATFTIGQVATEVGLSTDSVRFYEQKGLIDEPARGKNGYRQYPEATVARLMFIKHTKSMGFTLKEIHELLSIQRNTTHTCDDVRRQVAKKLKWVEEKSLELGRMKGALEYLVRACEDEGDDCHCPILDAWEKQEQRS